MRHNSSDVNDIRSIHKVDAKDPTKRSCVEMAAAEPCTVHIHSTTHTCQKNDSKSATGHKGIVDDWDKSDDDEGKNDMIGSGEQHLHMRYNAEYASNTM